MATYKNFDSLVADLKKQILDKIQSRDTMDLVGQTAKDLIYKRVKTGKGVASDTDEFPETTSLKPLSESYKKQRSKKGVKGEFASPTRSNLTNTGEMLDSMTHKPTVGKVTIEIPDTQRTDGETNSNVAKFVREERPFFNLSRSEALVVSKTITKIIDGITRLFNK